MTDAPGATRLPVARAFGLAVLYLGAGFALMLLLFMVGAALVGVDVRGAAADSDATLLVLQSVSGLLAYGFLTWVIGIRGLKLGAADLRWHPLPLGLKGFLGGLVLGALPAALAVLLSLVVGHARFAPDTGDLASYFGRVGLTALLLAPAALLEEVMFRGVGQVALARAMGRWRAVVLLSVLFALAHIRNPNTTSLGLLNIALAGVFLGAAFYLPGGIWTAWGAHLGWNATLAAMDAPVSGLPFKIPLIDYLPGGPTWLTGGSFGPEGGLLATATILAATLIAWHRTTQEQTG